MVENALLVLEARVIKVGIDQLTTTNRSTVKDTSAG